MGLNGRKKKADHEGLKEQHGGEFSEFPYCFLYPELGAGETGHTECQWVQIKDVSKSLLFLIKGQGKEISSKIENSLTIPLYS